VIFHFIEAADFSYTYWRIMQRWLNIEGDLCNYNQANQGPTNGSQKNAFGRLDSGTA